MQRSRDYFRAILARFGRFLAPVFPTRSHGHRVEHGILVSARRAAHLPPVSRGNGLFCALDDLAA